MTAPAASRWFVSFLLALLCSGATSSLRAQVWQVDPAFAPALLNDIPATSSLLLTPLPDTSLLVRGAFTHFDGAPAAGFARLLPHGSRDPAFTSTFARQIRLVAPLPGGRLIAITDSRDRNTPSQLERLLPDGSPDASYPPLSLFSATIVHLVPQPDGRVLLAGSFTTLGPLARSVLARLRDDGTLDPTFDAGRQLNYGAVTANALVAQPDGKVLLNTVTTVTDLPVSGSPSTLYRLTRLNADGTVDASFGLEPTSGGTLALSLSSSPYHALAVQPDGKILAATGNLLVRLSSNGIKDPTFNPTIPGLRRIDQIVALADGRSLVQARISPIPSATNSPLVPSSVFLLDASGTVIRDFRTSLPAGVSIELLAAPPAGPVTVRYGVPILTSPATPTTPIDPGINVTPSGAPTSPVTLSDSPATLTSPQTAVAAFFPLVLGLDHPTLARLDLSGTRAPRFEPAFTQRSPVTVSQLSSDSAGRLVAAGNFTSVNGTLRPGLARFLADGPLDASFVPTQTGDLVLLQPDGKVLLRRLVSGPKDADGVAPLISTYARLLSDGSPDLAFKPTGLPPAAIIHAVGSDGHLLASGFEPDATREENLKLFRLNPDGSRAATLSTAFRNFHVFRVSVLFPTTAPADYEHADQIRALHSLPDGKLFITATASTINGFATAGFVRLNPDGTTDPTYRPALNDSSLLSAPAEVSFLSAGRVLYNAPHPFDSPALPTLRLLADGSRDPSFTPLPGTVVSSVLELAGQSLLSTSGTRRWLANGLPDLNYHVTFSSNSYNAVAAEASGRIHVGGNFTSVNGQPRPGLARLVPVETPGFTQPPQSQTVVAGRDLTFQAALGTSAPATYQWTRNGLPVSGATGPALLLRPAKVSDAGIYRLIATTGGQTYVSAPAILTVVPNTARLVNFSARSRVSADTPPQIAGWILRDTAPRPVLLRATGTGLPLSIGPTGSLLRKPVLRMFQGGLLLAENTGGPLSPAVAAVAQKVGAFPLSSISFPSLPSFTGSAALLLALPAGSYTAHTASGDDRSGLALFEFYDAADATAPPALANASILARTAPGADALIAGFVISGNGPVQLLIRGLGPALTRFGITDALADPRLDLFAGRPLRATNAAWTGDPTLTAAARSAGAFPLSATSRDSALLLTLEPGAYTTQLSSASGQTGTAMIELYVLDL